MVDPQFHRYEDGPTTCRPSAAVLKSIRQSIKKNHVLSAADIRLACYMGLIPAVAKRPTGFNDGVFYPPGEAPLSQAPANRPLREDMGQLIRDVCLTPESGRAQRRHRCLLSAISRLRCGGLGCHA
jgi:hypothetical protein